MLFWRRHPVVPSSSRLFAQQCLVLLCSKDTAGGGGLWEGSPSCLFSSGRSLSIGAERSPQQALVSPTVELLLGSLWAGLPCVCQLAMAALLGLRGRCTGEHSVGMGSKSGARFPVRRKEYLELDPTSTSVIGLRQDQVIWESLPLHAREQSLMLLGTVWGWWNA